MMDKLQELVADQIRVNEKEVFAMVTGQMVTEVFAMVTGEMVPFNNIEKFKKGYVVGLE